MDTLSPLLHTPLSPLVKHLGSMCKRSERFSVFCTGKRTRLIKLDTPNNRLDNVLYESTIDPTALLCPYSTKGTVLPGYRKALPCTDPTSRVSVNIGPVFSKVPLQH
jgi:hypothetical protein